MSSKLFESSWAVISECGRYRFALGRRWGDAQPLALWVMLNPSTADASVDDPTIRRVRSFTQREGLGGFVVVNLFALRATDPKKLMKDNDPWGPDNHETVMRWVNNPEVKLVVAAWGATRRPPSSVSSYLATDASPMCLGVTSNGSPRHPLYVRSDAPLIPWSG